MRLERRLTIDEISERLALPRSTVFHWVRDIEISRADFGSRPRSPAQQRVARLNQERAAAVRRAAYDRGVAEFGSLDALPTFRDFVCMYIGEGTKRDRHKVALCNSDPAVIRLASTWMHRFARNPIRHSLQFHADQSPLELRLFWGGLLGVEPDAIRCQRKSNSGRLAGRSWRSRHGVLTVECCDVLFRARLGAWMDLVRCDWP